MPLTGRLSRGQVPTANVAYRRWFSAELDQQVGLDERRSRSLVKDRWIEELH
jgi:hypothetical protein